MTDQPSPEQAVRLLRAKAAELEARVQAEWDEVDQPTTVIGLNMAFINLAADIALVAQLLAEHMEHCGLVVRPGDKVIVTMPSSMTHEQVAQMYRTFSDSMPEVAVVVVCGATVAVQRRSDEEMVEIGDPLFNEDGTPWRRDPRDIDYGPQFGEEEDD